MAQEFFEINGVAGQNTLGAVGGVLGQIIVTLNIIEKTFNRQLTSKSTKSKKSSKSGKSKGAKSANKDDDAKSHKSEKSGKSAEKELSEKAAPYDPLKEPVLTDKGWFTRQNVQNFIHQFIGEKMKTEKMNMLASKAMVDYLSNLAKPVELNVQTVKLADAKY